MNLVPSLRRLLMDPRLEHVDYDSDDLTEIHRRILAEKPLMREVFADFYRLCRELDARHFAGAGRRVELGAGVSIFKQLYPDVLCTDVKHTPSVDLVVDAQAMPFAAGSVRAFYALNCFHHFPRPELFFAELARVLNPGGGCVLIEPYHGPVARRFYERLFATEGFDPAAPGWTTSSSGVMKGANQALSYIVFQRDVAQFRQRHPALEIVDQRPLHNYWRYLLSGGLNFRQLVPTFLSPAIRKLEVVAAPLDRFLALHHVVVLRKR